MCMIIRSIFIHFCRFGEGTDLALTRRNSNHRDHIPSLLIIPGYLVAEKEERHLSASKWNSTNLSCKYSLLPIPSGRQLKLDWSFIIMNDTFSVQSTADVEASWIFCSLSFRCLLIFLRSQRLLSVNVLMLVFCLCV